VLNPETRDLVVPDLSHAPCLTFKRENHVFFASTILKFTPNQLLFGFYRVLHTLLGFGLRLRKFLIHLFSASPDGGVDGEGQDEEDEAVEYAEDWQTAVVRVILRT
jgi:hypothetical protein